VQKLRCRGDCGHRGHDDSLAYFGRIDVWIQNAGIGAVGNFSDTPLDVHHQVIETNLLGALNGAYTALPIFRKQKHGIFIATNSVGAWVPLPVAAAYSASKYGLRGLIEALQAEVSDEKAIHFCEVAPAFVDTPGIDHVANFTGRKLKNPPGAGDPMRVARAMVTLSKHPRSVSTPVMVTTTLARMGYFIFPKLTRWASAKVFNAYFAHADLAQKTEGAVFKPSLKPSGVRPGKPDLSGNA
jgi:short-subunit dehydrogenase